MMNYALSRKLCSKTIPNKIVYYSAMYCVRLNQIIAFGLFELFTIKCVQIFNTKYHEARIVFIFN